MQPAPKRTYTEDDYLAQEGASEVRHEFVNGDIVAMAGAGYEHNAIAANIMTLLAARLRAAGRRCQVLGSDQRVHVQATGLYTYPDVSVVCGPPRFHDKDPRALLNPLLLVEVLSESTESYDRGAKLAHYRRTPDLQEILLVESLSRRVEHHRRVDERRWELMEYDAGVVPVLGCELTVEEMYDVLPPE